MYISIYTYIHIYIYIHFVVHIYTPTYAHTHISVRTSIKLIFKRALEDTIWENTSTDGEKSLVQALSKPRPSPFQALEFSSKPLIRGSKKWRILIQAPVPSTKCIIFWRGIVIVRAGVVEWRRLELISLYEDLSALEFYYSLFPCSRILYMVLSSLNAFTILCTISFESLHLLRAGVQPSVPYLIDGTVRGWVRCLSGIEQE